MLIKAFKPALFWGCRVDSEILVSTFFAFFIEKKASDDKKTHAPANRIFVRLGVEKPKA